MQNNDKDSSSASICQQILNHLKTVTNLNLAIIATVCTSVGTGSSLLEACYPAGKFSDPEVFIFLTHKYA